MKNKNVVTSFIGKLTNDVVLHERVLAKIGTEVYGYRKTRGTLFLINTKEMIEVPNSFVRITEQSKIVLRKSDPGYEYVVPDKDGAVTLCYKWE